MKKPLLLMAGLLLLRALLPAQHTAASIRTTVQNGTLEGTHDPATGLHLYLGIPYAQPPVGALRWQAPQAANDWAGVREAKQFAPSPVQANVFGDMRFRSVSQSEDCLYLNVWAPAQRSAQGLPVLVYFYGGGFVAGDGSEPRYDGASMAQKGIVVVTVNYRLNIFGFFAHPELSAEATYRASGNYGLLDQALSLQWVRDNIAAFGGDPQRVTIAGESAGSISVSSLMASPLSKGLIAGAIGESGAAIYPTLAPIPLAEAEQVGQAFAESIGHPTLAELRALSTDDIFAHYKASGRFGFPTVIDGYFYPNTLPAIFNARAQAQVPLLLGWNSAEIPGMAFMQGAPYSPEAYTAKVKKAYPDDHKKVLKLYPGTDAATVELSATALASDDFIAYSTWKWFDLHRKNSAQPVYRYLYSKLRPPLVDSSLATGLAGGTVKQADTTPPAPKAIGAPHACEIEYCMGNLYLVTEFAWTDEDHRVSATMQQYFANFIITGNPNCADLPAWPAAQPNDKKPPVMVIDVNSRTVSADDDARYRFLDGKYMGTGNK